MTKGIVHDLTGAVTSGPGHHFQSREAQEIAGFLADRAQDLWEATGLHDPGDMWEEARRVASAILDELGEAN